MNRFAKECECSTLGVLFYISRLYTYFGLRGPFQETNNLFVLTGVRSFLIHFIHFLVLFNFILFFLKLLTNIYSFICVYIRLHACTLFFLSFFLVD